MSGARGGFVVTVDEEAVQVMLSEAESGVSRFVDRVALDLEQNVRGEAGARSVRLGAPWEVQVYGGSVRKVVAPEWWAHFLAHGTRDHGPASAPALMFFEDGEIVVAQHVSGIAADPFDERAALRTQSRVGELLAEVV